MGKVKQGKQNRHDRRSAAGPFAPECCNKWHEKWQSSNTSELKVCPAFLMPVFKKIPGKNKTIYNAY